MKIYQYKIKKSFVKEVKTVTITQPKFAAEISREFIDFARDQEQLIVLFLDVKNRVKSSHLCTIGTVNYTVVHPREVFKPAIIAGGVVSIILVHNHPSGDTTPSKEDFNITQKIKNAGEILGIKLLDHLIVTEDDFYSFSDEGNI